MSLRRLIRSFAFHAVAEIYTFMKLQCGFHMNVLFIEQLKLDRMDFNYANDWHHVFVLHCKIVDGTLAVVLAIVVIQLFRR